MTQFQQWLREHHVTEVECIVADINGIARGKILPGEKFLRSLEDDSLRLPESIFIQTVTGDYPEEDVIDPIDRDIRLRPDFNSIRLVPWYPEPTAQVIADCVYHDGSPVEISARHVLRRVLALYEEKGWKPVVAPELEFFLTKINEDPDYPLVPPVGRSRRQETARQSFGIDAVNEFDPIFEDVYDWCEAQGIDIDTLTHEAGAAQMEINFNHGDALELADQAFLFKRTLRQAALKHGIYATFMAKPMENEPGSSMHVHQSVYSFETGRNLFSNADGEASELFHWFIGGLQKFLPAAMPLLAPNVNSYRRLRRWSTAPINVHWGIENRTVGLRVPISSPDSRRVENRIAGADANPYLAIAASLACGWLGMVGEIEPTDPIKGSAYRLAQTLPQQMPDALRKLHQSGPLKEVLGESFVEVLLAVKQAEHDAYQRVISSWEREHLLLNV
ncbi:glutamine synthetase family protein [Benzoatithermus flavus]|uniref:Glutamine synthetase family protein n=1 Tax=Benzoatithermus flavus TaxID=3108223 RepID=A0ABU8XTJ5_9PROT